MGYPKKLNRSRSDIRRRLPPLAGGNLALNNPETFSQKDPRVVRSPTFGKKLKKLRELHLLVRSEKNNHTWTRRSHFLHHKKSIVYVKVQFQPSSVVGCLA